MLWLLQNGKNLEFMETNLLRTYLPAYSDKEMGLDVIFSSEEKIYGFECFALTECNHTDWLDFLQMKFLTFLFSAEGLFIILQALMLIQKRA